MSTPAIEKSFCTTREAATLLGVSVGTVQMWVESGLLKAWKTAGGHRRVLRSSVDSLLRTTPSANAVSGAIDIASPLPDTAPKPFTMLVVDDDVHLLRLYKAKIAAWPLRPQLRCVDNAFAALLLIGHGGPDVLVTDLQMPGIDGFSMLRVLAQAPEIQNTRVVVVSGLDQAEIQSRGGLPAGIEVLPKPIPFDRLSAIALEVASARGVSATGH